MRRLRLVSRGSMSQLGLPLADFTSARPAMGVQLRIVFGATERNSE